MSFYEDKEILLLKRTPNKPKIEEHATSHINSLLEALGSQYVVYSISFDDYPKQITLWLGCHGIEPDEDFDVDFDLWHKGLKPLSALYGAPINVPYWYWSK